MQVSLTEMENQWSLMDLEDAHLALDLRDELQLKATEKPRS